MSEEKISKTLDELLEYDNIQTGERIKQSIIACLMTDDRIWCAFRSVCATAERCPNELCWLILDETSCMGHEGMSCLRTVNLVGDLRFP
jgi:hypothetical protein